MLKRWRFAWAWMVGVLLIIGCGSWPPWQPPTEPTPPPQPVPPVEEQCHLVVPPAHCACYANPPDGEPNDVWQPNWTYVCCETDADGNLIHVPTPEDCPVTPELPQPQCSTFTDRGGTLQPLDGACDCYIGQDFVECPEPVDCPAPFPQGQDQNLTVGPVFTDWAETVDVAMKTLTGCAIGDWTCPTHMEPDEWMHAVLDMVKRTGLCAGRHIDTTPGGTDEIAVTDNCSGWWEGYKIYNYGTGAVIWSQQAKRPAYRLNDTSACGGAPPPVDPPPGGECVDPDPTGLEADFTLKKHGNIWDSTYKVKGREYCDAVCSPLEPDVCFTGRLWCPMRFEGDPERAVCYAKHVGVQQWWCDGQEIESTANPAQAKCHGHVRTCTEDGRTCAEEDWIVASMSPTYEFVWLLADLGPMEPALPLRIGHMEFTSHGWITWYGRGLGPVGVW